jgi:hypothetical protein
MMRLRRSPKRPCGASLLEAVAAIAVMALLLGDAAEQARIACRTIREAESITKALTSARNVLDLALATPCAPIQSAAAACDAGSHCTISASEAGRRNTASGALVLVRVVVEVTKASEAIAEPRLARLVGVIARPEVCS